MILSLVRKRRSKIILIFDNSEKLEIEYEVYLNSGLIKGDEVDKKRIDELVFNNDIFLIKNSAYRYLGNRNHSSFELKLKLSKKGYQKNIIDQVIQELKANGYIDDQKFAELFIRDRIERRKEGIVKITSELRKKRIATEIISGVISNVSDDPIHFKNALEIAERKYKLLKNKELDYQKLKVRLFNFLKGKGFTSDIIFSVIDKILEEENYDQINY